MVTAVTGPSQLSSQLSAGEVAELPSWAAIPTLLLTSHALSEEAMQPGKVQLAPTPCSHDSDPGHRGKMEPVAGRWGVERKGDQVIPHSLQAIPAITVLSQAIGDEKSDVVEDTHGNDELYHVLCPLQGAC